MKTALHPAPPKLLMVNFPSHIHHLFTQKLNRYYDTEFVDSLIEKPARSLDQYYKVVLCAISPIKVTDFEVLTTSLQGFKSLLVLAAILPTPNLDLNDSALVKAVNYWTNLAKNRAKIFQKLLQRFPMCQMLVFDGLYLKGVPNGLLHVLFSLVDEGLVLGFDQPKHQISVITEVEFCNVVVEKIQQPFQPKGWLVSSQPIELESLIIKTKQNYEKLYDKPLALLRLTGGFLLNLPLPLDCLIVPPPPQPLNLSNLYQYDFFATATKTKLITTQKDQNTLLGVLGFNRTLQINDLKQRVADVDKKNTKKNRSRQWFFYGGLISAIVAIFLMLSAWNYYLNVQKIGQSLVEQMANNTISSPHLTDISRFISPETEAAAIGLSRSTEWWDRVVSHPIIDQAKTITQFTNQLSSLKQLMIDNNQLKGLIYQHILNLSSTDLSQQINQHGLLIERIFEETSKLQTSVDQLGYLTNSPDQTLDLLQQISQNLDRLKIAQIINKNLAKIVGWQGSKTYLILFQDTGELRPSGGMILGGVLLELHDGQIQSFQSFDADQISNNVLSRITPPATIIKHLGERQWYFYDSNWQPDFAQSSKTMAWFVNQAMDREIDGVIAIHTSTLTKMLDKLQEFESAEQVLDLQSAEQLENFLNSAPNLDTQQLWQKFAQAVLNLNPKQIDELLQVGNQELDSGQILLRWFDLDDQDFQDTLGWDGRVFTPSCSPAFSGKSCVSDGVYQVEANIGYNRVSSSITTKISDLVEYDGDKIIRTRKVSWSNPNTTNVWPLGEYRAYLRWYLPPQALFVDLSIGGVSQVSRDLDLSTENGRVVLGMPVVVGLNQTVEMEIKYHLPFVYPDQLQYVYFQQNQPGKLNLQHSFQINFPQDWRVNKIAQQPTFQQPGSLKFDVDPNRRTMLAVEFSLPILSSE